MKSFFLSVLLVVLAIITTNAQKRSDASAWTISGYVTNLITGENVTDTILVELITPDSVVVNRARTYALTGQYANWQFDVGNEYDSYIIRLSNPAYETNEIPVKLTRGKRKVKLGATPIRRLTIEERNLMLGEVTVKATKIKFYNKGDTVVFNADAFNMAQGSMLDELIAQLPGVEININGVIKVNGRPVNALLLNGKDFFKGNRAVMLENLHSYMVKNVKIYEKIEQEERQRHVISNDNLVMDINLKKQFNEGIIANASAAGGSNERYELRAFGLIYNNRKRLATYASANNINRNLNPGSDGNWNEQRNQMNQTTQSAGMDYGLFGQQNRYEINGNLTGTISKPSIEAVTIQQSFLPQGDTYNYFFNNSSQKSYHLATDHNLRLRFGDALANSIRASIQGMLSKSNVRMDYVKALFSQSPEAEVTRDSLITNSNLANSALNRMLENRKSRVKDASITASADAQFAVRGRDDVFGFNSSFFASNRHYTSNNDYKLFIAAEPSQITDKKNRAPNSNVNAVGSAYYDLNFNNHLSMTARYRIYHSHSNSTNDWYVADHMPQTVSMAEEVMRQLDPVNSYHTRSSSTDQHPSLLLKYYYTRKFENQDDGYFYMHASASPIFRNSNLIYTGLNDFNLKKNFVLPNADVLVQFTSHRNYHYLDLKYRLNTYDPSLLNMVDLTLTSDPLNHHKGNPDLKCSTTHHFEANYRADGLSRERGMWISAQLMYEFTRNASASAKFYDRTTGINTITPINVNGNGFASARSDLNIPLTHDRALTFGTTAYYRYSRNADVITESGMETPVKSIVNTQSTWNILSLEYTFGRHRIKARGEMNYSHLSSARINIQNMDIFEYSYGINGMATLPLNFQISSDIFMHSNRGYNDNSMNINSLVWNASLGKSIAKGKVILKLEAFDILGKIKRTRVQLNAQGRTETFTNTLPRYVMLYVQYNFNHKPANKH